MVACADDPGAEIQDGIQVDQARGGLGADHAHLVEHDGHQHRGEEFEESFDPKMDDPEAPVVNNGEVGVGAIEKGGQVEERDGHGSVQKQCGQFALVRNFEGGPKSPKHQKKPEEEAPRQQELPEPTEVQVLGTLVTEPEPQLPQLVVDAEELAYQAADDDHHERPKECVDASLLVSGLFATDPRRQEKAAAHPGRGDPEDGELEVPVSCLSWNWRERSSVKITERTYEKREKALHRGREGSYPE